jgi:hypothetical protein
MRAAKDVTNPSAAAIPVTERIKAHDYRSVTVRLMINGSSARLRIYAGCKHLQVRSWLLHCSASVILLEGRSALYFAPVHSRTETTLPMYHQPVRKVNGWNPVCLTLDDFNLPRSSQASGLGGVGTAGADCPPILRREVSLRPVAGRWLPALAKPITGILPYTHS